MDKAFSWIGDIFDFIFSLFPTIIVVNANERAIKFSRGKKVREVGPGIHWYWPLVTDEPESVNITRDSSAFPTQKLVTDDGKPVAVSVVLVYRVVDVRKAVVNTNDYESVMADVIGAACTRAVRGRAWDDLLRGVEDGSIQEELLAWTSDELVDFGVQALDVKVKDVCPVRVLALVGDGFLTGAADEGGDE